jgi:hypothetical protein
MGRLIDARDFRIEDNRRESDRKSLDPFWHFRVRRTSVSVGYEIEESYPALLTIHFETLEGRFEESTQITAAKLRIEMRKFIERQMETDVIWRKKMLTHVRVFPRRAEDRKRYESRIEHGYYHFNFEDDASAIFFKMRFGEHCKTISPYHPDFPPSEGCDDFFDERTWSRFQHEHWADFV